jgi:pSer/pThr/pTyr-binding forkhead associated (FHA) protein
MKMKTLGRDAECNIVLDHESVSRMHAQIRITDEGYLAIQDVNSGNGTFLNRNNRWIRVKKAILGTEDRIRFGEQELPLEKLVEALGGDRRVRLREGYSVRGKPLVFDQHRLDLHKPKVILENPRRNPVTGNIEENR